MEKESEVAYRRFFEEAMKINRMLFDIGYSSHQCCRILHMADEYWHMVIAVEHAKFTETQATAIKKANDLLDKGEVG